MQVQKSMKAFDEGDEGDEEMTISPLEGLSVAHHAATIYIPSMRNDGTRIDMPTQKKWTSYIVESFSALFGGATAKKAVGGWLDKSGNIITENVILVTGFFDGDISSVVNVVDIARNMKAKLQQDAVSVEVDGSMYFVE